MKAKSRSPSVRALDELKEFHEREIGNIGATEMQEHHDEITKVKESVEKNTTEQVVRAIRSLNIPYKLQHASLCNVRNYNGTLRFEIEFDPHKSKDAMKHRLAIDKIIAERKAQTKRLEQWYISGLYRIAGRSEIPEFRVDAK